jgi:hypothetical protein
MIRHVRTVLVLLALAVAAGSSLRAHEQFRFVGHITRWDAKNQILYMSSRETWDGKVGDYNRRLFVREDTKVMRMFQEVPRSELKPGLYVVVDASGDRIDNVDATEIDIKTPAAPAKKK